MKNEKSSTEIKNTGIYTEFLVRGCLQILRLSRRKHSNAPQIGALSLGRVKWSWSHPKVQALIWGVVLSRCCLVCGFHRNGVNKE